MECVLKHSAATGDGSKTFILLLASLLRAIHTIACKEPNVSHTYKSRNAAEAVTARHLADELLTFALEELLYLIAVGVVPYGRYLSWDDCTATQLPSHTKSHCVQKLLASFFQSRLSRSHSDFISTITCDLLTRCQFKNGQHLLLLQFVADNFPALHTQVSGFPISCSRLVEGLVIHRDFATPCLLTGNHQPVKALVFTGYIEPKLFSSGDMLELELGKEKSIVQYKAWAEMSLGCLFAHLKRLGVSVLFCHIKQSAAVLTLAEQADMCIVECVSEDELSLLVQLSGTRPIIDCRVIEPDNVATLTFCRPIQLGAHRYENAPSNTSSDFNYCIYSCQLKLNSLFFIFRFVHVAFHDSEERVMVKPCSLIICGATEGQTDQNACAIQDAIQMLRSAWKPLSATASERICLNTGDQMCRIPVLQPGCVIPAGGTFELLLNHALLQRGHRRSVSHLLADALLCVPRQIYSHRPRSFLQRQAWLLTHAQPLKLAHKREKSVCPLDDATQADISSEFFMSSSGLESVSCKYQLLLAVLQCLTRLLQVDVVLHTHAALRRKSHRLTNISWDETEDEGED